MKMKNKKNRGRQVDSIVSSSTTNKDISDDVLEAINLEDEDKVQDFKEQAKSSRARDTDTSRFECILNNTSLK